MKDITIWEEKNFTELMTKSENNPIFAQNVGIKEINKKFVKNVCENIGNKKIWKRNCPKCGKELFHKNINGFKHSIKLNKWCISCSNLEKPFKHHILTKNSLFKRNCPICNKKIFYKNKINLSNSINNNSLCSSCCIKGKTYPYKPKPNLQGNKHPLYGKKRSVDERNKISKSLIGRKISFIHRENISKARIGMKLSEETIKKQRIASRERILKQLDNIYGHICYNPKACKYFDELNLKNKWNLRHALNGNEVRILGYSLDSYDKNLNIVVEYDESRHYDIYGNLKYKDVIRMNEIKTHLNCKFYRYNEKKNILIEY